MDEWMNEMQIDRRCEEYNNNSNNNIVYGEERRWLVIAEAHENGSSKVGML